MVSLNTPVPGLSVTLHAIGSKPEKREVATLADASREVRSFVESNGYGASQLGRMNGCVRVSGRVYAHVSYNGRVWDKDNRIEVRS